MAQFAAPTPDENLVPGWNSQGNFTNAATLGVPGAGYSQAAPFGQVTPLTGQANAGFPNPPGAMNVGSENSAAYSTSVLANPGYADGSLIRGATATTPIPTTAGVNQPFGTEALVSLVIPVSVTAIATAPFTTGTPVYTNVWTGTSSAGQVVVFSVPGDGWIRMTGANATSVTYTIP